MNNQNCSLSHFWIIMGPITGSVLSLFISFLIIQPIACMLDPTFNLLANRGVGKVAFVAMVIMQILLFIALLPQPVRRKFFTSSILFIKEKNWLPQMFMIATLFFALHALMLAGLYSTEHVTYTAVSTLITTSRLMQTIFGFFVVFLLAWSEELIFRGMIYQYFAQHWQPLTSCLVTAFIFMLAHDLSCPWRLMTTKLPLGMGLFLLGVVLNLLFIISDKLYIAMGAHMGLVAVKVLLRRIPFLVFVPATQWGFWVHSDLRQSPLVHLLFASMILYLCVWYRTRLFSQSVKHAIANSDTN